MANRTGTAERAGSKRLEDLHHFSGWFIGLGIALVVLGGIAIASATITTITTLRFFGWLLIAGGILETFHALWRLTWGELFLNLLTGIIYLVVGAALATHPAATAAVLTILIAVFLIVVGVFRIVAALFTRYPNWGWFVMHGIVSLALGILIREGWPTSSLWVIGLYIGFELLANGFALIMTGIAAKRLSRLIA